MKRALALLFVVALLAAACGGGDDDAEPTGGGGQTEEGGGEEEEQTIALDGFEANLHGEEDVSGKSSVEFEMDDFYFEPTILKGEPGQKLMLHVHNEGDALHNIQADELKLDEDVDAGQSAEIDVEFPESGQLVFICKYHAQQGMVGALEAGM